MMFLLLCLYAAQPHAVAQATPAELIAAIYAEHNPGKLDAMASLLEKYAGHEQQLLESVMQKYGIVEPPSISILDGGASPDEDDLVSVEADTTATAAPAAAEQGEGATEQLEGAMDPNLPPEDRMVALLETQLGDNLMKIASRLGRKLQDLRTRPPVEAGREVRQAAVASYLKDLAEFVEPRPTLALFGDTATQATVESRNRALSKIFHVHGSFATTLGDDASKTLERLWEALGRGKLGALAAAEIVEIAASSLVAEIQDDSWQQYKSHHFVLIDFYAPWCGHCQELAPEFAGAASLVAANSAMPEVSFLTCDASRPEAFQLKDEFAVRTYPSLRWRVGGEHGEWRDITSMITFKKRSSIVKFINRSTAAWQAAVAAGVRVADAPLFGSAKDWIEQNRFEKYGSEIAAALGQPGMTSMGRLSMQQFAELGRERDLRKLKLKGAKMVERKRWSRQILQMIEDYHKAAESRPQASQSEL